MFKNYKKKLVNKAVYDFFGEENEHADKILTHLLGRKAEPLTDEEKEDKRLIESNLDDKIYCRSLS